MLFNSLSILVTDYGRKILNTIILPKKQETRKNSKLNDFKLNYWMNEFVVTKQGLNKNKRT